MQEPMEKSAFGIFVIDDLPGPRDQHRTIGAIEDAAGQISHDVVPESAPRLGRAGHDQIVFARSHLGENLIKRESMADPDLDGESQFFELFLLSAEVASQLGVRC